MTATAELWEPLRRAERWIREAVVVLTNHEQRDRAGVQQAYTKVLRSIGVTKRHCGELEAALLGLGLPRRRLALGHLGSLDQRGYKF